MTAGRNNSESLSQNWCTPPKYVNAIRDFFGGEIGLDPCSNKHSLTDARIEYCLPKQDGLKKSWIHGPIFVNPPYGRDKERGTSIRDWMRKCSETHHRHGIEVIALVPVATNTRHWKESVFGKANAIAFLYDTRLKFLENGEDNGKGAPMSCALIYWGSRYRDFSEKFISFGAVLDIRNLKGRTIGKCTSQKNLPFDILEMEG